MSNVEWDINDNNIPTHISKYDDYEEWPTGHTKLINKVTCEEADKHSSGWAMRNTNNHNVNILKKSCLGVLVCSNRCTFENGQSINMRPAICDKARKKQQGKPCPNRYCSGRLEILPCRGHCGYPVTHFWRHTAAGIFFQAKGSHDHPRPEAKSTAESKRSLRTGARSSLKRKNVPLQYNFSLKENCVEMKSEDIIADLFSPPPKIQRIVTSTAINGFTCTEYQRISQEEFPREDSQAPLSVDSTSNTYSSHFENCSTNELVNYSTYDVNNSYVNNSYVQNDSSQCQVYCDNPTNYWSEQYDPECQWVAVANNSDIKSELAEGSYSDYWHESIPNEPEYNFIGSKSPVMYDSSENCYPDNDSMYQEVSFESLQDNHNQMDAEFQKVSPDDFVSLNQLPCQYSQDNSWAQETSQSSVEVFNSYGQKIFFASESNFSENNVLREHMYDDYDLKSDMIVAEAIGCVSEIGQYYTAANQIDNNISCNFVNKQNNQFNSADDLVPIYA